jgi:succinylarginine dihydrolase
METATLAIAKLTGEAGALAWKVENQPAPLSDAQFGKVTLTARTLFGACAVSLEAVQDASNIDQVIENSLAMSAALALDLAALRGDGTAASPIGIRNAPGVQLVDLGTNGATLTSTTFYPKWSQACQLIMQKNGIPRTTIFAPRTWSEQDLLANTLNDALEAPDSWKNLQKLVTNQVPINNTKGSSNASSEAYVGDFQQMLVGIRSELNLEISRVAGDSTGSAFRSGQIWIRIFMRADIQLARPEHFVLIDGIL